jgi:tetratricopeptide (TPR) repeat protein
VARPSSPSAERGTRLGARSAVLLGALVVASIGSAGRADAQPLALKRTLTVGPAPGCEAATAPPFIERRDNAEARRLAAAGQEAALVGDQVAARDAFARAAVLNPTDERIAYDLGRAHEDLADTTKAVAEYCRYLVLSPSGREAADVRARLLGLVPRAVVEAADAVEVAFRLGLAQFDDGRYDAAVRAFDEVVQKAPAAIEGSYNRGLARAALGRRADALADLETFRAAAPSVDDRVAVARAVDVLRRPVYSPAMAFARSLLPGFGQIYTGRPVRGVFVMATVAASAGLAVTSRTGEREVAYVDPNGVPAPYTEAFTERPYFTAGAATAVGLTVLGMIDAVVAANRSQRGASIVERRRTASATAGRDRDVAIAPTIDPRGGAGLLLRARF